MQFQLEVNARPFIFFPYRTHERQYHVLLTERVPMDSIISVVDSEDVKDLPCFFSIGDVKTGGYEGRRCGFIFHTTFPVVCHGSSIMAYSRQWEKAVNEKRFPLQPFWVSLVLRADYFYIYHKKNQVSLLVSPQIASRIRENLEV